MQAPFFSLLLLRMGVGAFFFWTGLLKTEWILLLIGALLFLGLFIKVAATLGALALIAPHVLPMFLTTALSEVVPNIPIVIVIVIVLAVLFFGRTGEFMGIDGYIKSRKVKV